MWEINEFTIQDELENIQKKIYKNCFENCFKVYDLWQRKFGFLLK